MYVKKMGEYKNIPSLSLKSNSVYLLSKVLELDDEVAGRVDDGGGAEGGVLLQHVPQDVQQLSEALVARIPAMVGINTGLG